MRELQNKINKNYEATITLLKEIIADSTDHPRFDEILRVHNEIITEKSAYLIAAYQETGN